MKIRLFLITLLISSFALLADAQHKFTAKISFAEEIKSECKTSGRLYIFFAASPYGEPYKRQFPNPGGETHIFARNYENVDLTKGIDVAEDLSTWSGTPSWGLNEVKPGEYIMQVLWDQDTSESRIEAPGNLHSEKKTITIKEDINLEFNISNVIKPHKIIEHPLSNFVKMKSKVLSKW